ncbi:MAG: hypothetical protein ACXQTE_05310 [Methanosarcinaceae archaeon]
MELDENDKNAIVEIVAAKYFSKRDWKWISLKKDVDRIYKAFDDLEDQYNKYPYMSKDWYVENSSTKNIHMCTKWNELNDLVNFMRSDSQYFDFLVHDNKKMLCITTTSEILSIEQKNAISLARQLRYNVFVFKATIPERIEFELSQIGGGM